MAFAVRTPPVSVTAWSRLATSMYWGDGCPKAPDPAVRDVRAGGIEYRHLIFFALSNKHRKSP
jgi:hypothetical protein